MTIDEIFAALPDEVAQDAHEYLVIDAASRTILVPESEKVFGVEADANAERKYFICPRYVGNHLDLASMFVTVNYRNADGYEDGYLVEDVAVNGDYVTFSWELWPNVTAYKGAVQFAVCADLPNHGSRRGPDWNTTMAQGEVLVGLDPDRGDLEEGTSDVLTQLRDEVVTQTANVEVTGIEQVKAVKAAGAAATAEAQEQIAAKGAATLATIPADYTTLANKTNEQANAIKGLMFGTVVRADDVSPVEHYPAVSVRSKNLIPYPFAEENTTRDGVTFTANADGSLTVSGTPTQNTSFNLTMQYQKTCLLKKGRAYTLSITANLTAETGYIYFQAWANGAAHMSKSIRKGTDSFTLEEDGYLQLGIVLLKGQTVNETIYCQLEQGPATEYTPYVDPSAVTVKRCSKNLIDSALMAATKTLNGVTITREGALLTLNGTLTTDSVLYSTSFCFYGSLGNWYTLSCKHAGGKITGTSSVCVGDCETPAAARQSWANVKMLNEDNALPFQMVKPFIKDLWFYATAGVSFENYKIKIQLETGKTATAFAPCNGITARPAADGTVAGLPSVAPSMALITDTENVTVECEYNRDSNAVYAELLAKIAALSGTT